MVLLKYYLLFAVISIFFVVTLQFGIYGVELDLSKLYTSSSRPHLVLLLLLHLMILRVGSPKQKICSFPNVFVCGYRNYL